MSGRRSLAARVQSLEAQLLQLPGISRPSEVEEDIPLERIISDQELLKFVVPLYTNGHYAQAVLEAFKYVNNLVKFESSESSRDGADLMHKVFSRDNPVLALNDLTTESDKNEQLGYMQILAGVMTGIRNPRAHESGWTESKDDALQLLSLADHLVKKIRSARKV